MVDERSVQRHRVLKAGKIEFGGGAMACSIRNMSRFGAVLEAASAVTIPESFTLVIPADGLRLPCRFVWRNERRIGVVFEFAPP
jgi:hypothetical protein